MREVREDPEVAEGVEDLAAASRWTPVEVAGSADEVEVQGAPMLRLQPCWG